MVAAVWGGRKGRGRCLFFFFPGVCSVFQCHEACIAIYSSMDNKKLSHWVVVSVISMLFCLLIYSLTGKLLSFHIGPAAPTLFRLGY